MRFGIHSSFRGSSRKSFDLSVNSPVSPSGSWRVICFASVRACLTTNLLMAVLTGPSEVKKESENDIFLSLTEFQVLTVIN